ncbi:MAG: DNA-deoxyinosine glycosylase, partial [Schwartzia sp.]|nr:DNA-deoxyinosine glycosylase [Schwartzia sp. (in: firmicutes)]
MANQNTRCVGLAPIVDEHARILILGSMPGAASLAAQEYYAHPANRFWPLMTRLLCEAETPSSYPERLAMLLRHHVALWDAIDVCDRAGSLDSDIRNATAND